MVQIFSLNFDVDASGAEEACFEVKKELFPGVSYLFHAPPGRNLPGPRYKRGYPLAVRTHLYVVDSRLNSRLNPPPKKNNSDVLYIYFF